MTGHKAGLQRCTACCCLLVGLKLVFPAKCSNLLLLQKSESSYVLVYKTDAVKSAETGSHINPSLQASTRTFGSGTFQTEFLREQLFFSHLEHPSQPSPGTLAHLGWAAAYAGTTPEHTQQKRASLWIGKAFPTYFPPYGLTWEPRAAPTHWWHSLRDLPQRGKQHSHPFPSLSLTCSSLLWMTHFLWVTGKNGMSKQKISYMKQL